MRLFALSTTLLLATAAMLALAPTGAADNCSGLTSDDCQHFVCVGRSTGYSNGYPREECKVDEGDLPNPCGPTALCQV
jgi:hypothetical protein